MAVKFRTPSGNVSAAAREAAEDKGQAMPGGRFPIRNAADLANAKQAVGRAKNPGPVKAFINRRAKALGEPGIGGKPANQPAPAKAGGNGNGKNGNGNRPPQNGNSTAR